MSKNKQPKEKPLPTVDVPLNGDELYVLLDSLQHKHGFGYSKNPVVGQLQARLSVFLELSDRKKQHE